MSRDYCWDVVYRSFRILMSKSGSEIWRLPPYPPDEGCFLWTGFKIGGFVKVCFRSWGEIPVWKDWERFWCTLWGFLFEPKFVGDLGSFITSIEKVLGPPIWIYFLFSFFFLAISASTSCFDFSFTILDLVCLIKLSWSWSLFPAYPGLSLLSELSGSWNSSLFTCFPLGSNTSPFRDVPSW